MRWTAAIACLAIAALATLTAGEVVVSASVPWHDRNGYTPVLVRAEALSGPVTLTLRATADTAAASDSIRVEPGRARLFTLLLPPHGGWGGVRLAWSGGGSGGEASHGATIDHQAADLIVLDPTETVPVPALGKLVDERVPIKGYHRSGERVRRLSAESLPDRWQGWPIWLSLIITEPGDAQLSPAQREAIATWTRSGGALFVTTTSLQRTWQRAGARVGLYDPAATEPPALLARLRAAANEDGRPVAAPVPGTEHLPIGWFLFLAIGFAALAGPLNLWWVRRRGRPYLLLITTPLLSAGACLLLIVVTLAADGIGRRRTVAQVVVLDAAAQRCVGFTAATYFCGIAPGRFALDPEDRLLPMDEADFRGWNSRDRPQIGLERNEGLWAESGWIPARINRQLAWTQARPERRRLTVRRDGNAWRIGNGLGVAVTALTWVDPQGAVFSTGRIEAGADAIARIAPAKVADSEAASVLRRLGGDARLTMAGLGQEPGTFTCRVAAPLLAIPGPEATDAEAPQAWVAGSLLPELAEAR